ncbi:helix-turn-helix transcriptional regulator [Fructobacillus fructosus]|uniref:helix-turn-helix domain-containing protein n=1 Tax=Fructobacillus fructosus TaxID=1631 RepID=UPI0030C7A2AD
MYQFSKRLKSLREKEGVTQRKMAKHIGMSAGTIANLENGYSKPSFDVLIDIADYFEMSLDDLVGRERRKNGEY